MAQELRSEEVIKIKRTTKFFCDICGKYLGESVEYEDGYLPEPTGCFDPRDDLKIRVGDDWYTTTYKEVCEDCLNKYYEKIIDALKKLNIEEE